MNQAYNICLELLQQRDYDIINKESDKIIAIKPDGNQMVTFFADIPKFNVKNIQTYISVMDEMSIFHAIIVYKEGVTSFTKKAIEQSLEMIFELFAVADLQYNITKHRLQPKFECLSEQETTKFKQEFGVRFPALRREDPIVRFYFFQKGDVIRVTRANKSIIYRIVKG